MMDDRFSDRRHAGRALATSPALARYRDREDVVVLALPRGGAPVAFEVASALHAPLEVFVVRKLGLPGQEELAMGAVSGGGMVILDEDLIARSRLPRSAIDIVIAAEKRELLRRELAYRDGRPAPDIEGRTAILVDDGLATGASMLAAIRALALARPARVVVAVPVGARSSCDTVAAQADELICPRRPEPFRAVGFWYREFPQTTDEEVLALLARARLTRTAGHGGSR